MKKRWIILVAVAMSISLAGCGATTSKNNTVSSGASSTLNVNDQNVLSPINGKVKAINDKKLSEYLSNYIANTSTYSTQKTEMTKYFQNYTVKASITDEKVLNKTSTDAQIQYVVSTKKVKGPSFLDSNTLYISNLKNVDGEWKINDESVIKVEFSNSVFNTVYNNIAALNKRDINAYMATIDPTDSDVYSKFKDDELDSFDKYNLTYTMESADIVGSTDDKDTAVKVVENIVKNDNSDYQNNTSTLMYQLKKVQGVWKIFKIETKQTNNLK